jgi:carbon monoxide dehydrogenase subunit G
MACVHKEISIDASADHVWAAVRDFGAAHERLFPGLLSGAVVEPGARVVTFANGMVVRELLVDLDDQRRRLVYAAVGGRTSHHNASIQVFADGAQRCRVLWITDLLPAQMAGPVTQLVEQGAALMKRTLEADRA